MSKLLKGVNLGAAQSLIANDSGNMPSEIQILPVGRWNTYAYGPIEITTDHIDEMVRNFKAGVRKAIPIDTDHDGGAANGWITDLEVKGTDGLFAKVKWNKKGEQNLKDEVYKLFSAEWAFDYVDAETGERFGSVLIAGTITNRPLFKELPLLIANDGTGAVTNKVAGNGKITLLLSNDTHMFIVEDVLKKPMIERTAEEVAFLKEKEAEMTEEQKAQLVEEVKTAEAEKVATEAATKAEADALAQKEADEKAALEAKAKEEEVIKANENKTITLKASEVEEYKKAHEELKVFKAAEVKRAIEEHVSKFVANEKGGKFLKKSKEAVVELYMSASEDQKTKLNTFIEQLPEIKIADELGSSKSADGLTATEKVFKLIEEVKAKESISEAKAQELVREANPELYKEYKAELHGIK